MWRVLLLGVMAAVGCSDDSTLLAVDLRTDYVPGVEFRTVRTVLVSEDGMSDRSTTEIARLTDDFVDGIRVAEIDGLSTGTLALRVELMAIDGRVVAARPVRVVFEGRTAVTVVVTRDCSSTTCPIAGGDPSATACLGGVCVDPSCVEERPEACGDPACVAPTDCPGGSACATAVCIAGTCLLDAQAGRCAADEYCDPELGCRAVPGGGGDTSPPADTGPPDVGGPIPACVDTNLGSALGDDIAVGNADGMGNDVNLSFGCDDHAGDDATFLWVAPAAGLFQVVASSDGSQLTLGAITTCDGDAVQCSGTSSDGDVSLDLTAGAGERHILVIDADSGGRVGNYRLSAYQECPNQDLASSVGPGVASDTTTGARDGLNGSCGGRGGEDVSLSWMVPSSGRYRFTARSSAFDPVIYVRDGACGGGELGCGAGAAGSASLESDLIGGVPVVIVVDGTAAATGAFTLDIESI